MWWARYCPLCSLIHSHCSLHGSAAEACCRQQGRHRPHQGYQRRPATVSKVAYDTCYCPFSPGPSDSSHSTTEACSPGSCSSPGPSDSSHTSSSGHSSLCGLLYCPPCSLVCSHCSLHGSGTAGAWRAPRQRQKNRTKGSGSRPAGSRPALEDSKTAFSAERRRLLLLFSAAERSAAERQASSEGTEGDNEMPILHPRPDE